MKFNIFLIYFLTFSCSLFADDTVTQKDSKDSTKETIKEEQQETWHKIKIQDNDLSYSAITGTLLLKDSEGKDKASIFYVSYTKHDVPKGVIRPITFCFNGGPGSSSIWLHLGAFGPRRVLFDKDTCINFPYCLVDNEYTLLDTTDLVFVDPVSSGFSKSAPGEEAKQFHEVESDIKWMSEFIRLYISKFNRWNSPKFIAGESYGTLRAVGVTNALHSQHNIDIQGIILISTALDFQLISYQSFGNDLPYVLSLPSYTATAWYQKKLSSELQNKSLESLLKDSEEFTLNEYSVALLKGDTLPSEEKQKIAEKLSFFTGLPSSYILQSNLRVPQYRFTQQLLKNEKQNVGRFDGRTRGWVIDECEDCMEYDPSAERIIGGISTAFNHYLNAELETKKDEKYVVIGSVRPWDFSKKASNRFLSVSESLRQSLITNPNLCVFVASGIYDLATPYFSVLYTFDHLNLQKDLIDKIKLMKYPGGHMMYSSEVILKELNADISSFIRGCTKREKSVGK